MARLTLPSQRWQDEIRGHQQTRRRTLRTLLIHGTRSMLCLTTGKADRKSIRARTAQGAYLLIADRRTLAIRKTMIHDRASEMACHREPGINNDINVYFTAPAALGSVGATKTPMASSAKSPQGNQSGKQHTVRTQCHCQSAKHTVPSHPRLLNTAQSIQSLRECSVSKLAAASHPRASAVAVTERGGGHFLPVGSHVLKSASFHGL